MPLVEHYKTPLLGVLQIQINLPNLQYAMNQQQARDLRDALTAELWKIENAAQPVLQADAATPCTCPRYSDGTKIFPMRECDDCRRTA